MVTAERERLIVAIARQLHSSGSELELGAAADVRAAAAETRITYVDLNADGKAEVIAQARGENSGCSPTGNCTLWILYRRGDKYEVLLEAEAHTFTVQPSRSKNFSDIVLTRHASAIESEVRVYKFDGRAYGEDGCYIAQWVKLDSDGEQHTLKEPRITRCDAQSTSGD